MDYNKFTYYRANPHANKGFMPPIAHMNRHQPEFITEIPMGEHHLGKIGRKQYTQNTHHLSNITAQSILTSPERYPYENRIALSKQYERNLNTIDIEGASGGTLVTQGVRNKMRARQQIKMRNFPSTDVSLTQIQVINPNQPNQEERRRKFAYLQYLKDQIVRKDNKQRNNQNKGREHYHNQEEQQYIQKSSHKSPTMEIQHKRLKSLDFDKPEQRLGTPKRKQFRDQEPSKNEYNSNYYKIENSSILQNRRLTKDTESDSHQKMPYYVPMPKDRQSLRLHNPTNLSSEGSLSLAGRNIIQRY